jgi:MFS family permease
VAAERRPTNFFGATLGALLFVELFSGIIQTFFQPLYPSIAKEYSVSSGALSWTLIGFTLAGAVTTPVFSRLGDIYGHRRLLRIEIGLVAVGSILIALTPSFVLLVIGRILQGMFTAYLPLMVGLLRSNETKSQTEKGIAYLTSILLFGTVIGSLVTGLLVRSGLGPTWALWVPAIGTVAGFFLLSLAPADIRASPSEEKPTVDWIGAILLAIGLGTILFGLDEGSDFGWFTGTIIGTLVVGIAALVLWIFVELHTRQPLADLRFLFRPAVAPIYLIGASLYFGAVGGQVALSTYVGTPSHYGYGLGYGAFGIALISLLVTVGAAVSSVFGKMLSGIIGYIGEAFLGSGLWTVGMVVLVIFHTSLVGVIIALAIGGLGLGLNVVSLRTLIAEHVREGEVAIGQGVYELFIVIGGAVGAGVLGGVMSANQASASAPVSESGYVTVWTIVAVFGLIGTVTSLLYRLRAPLAAAE